MRFPSGDPPDSQENPFPLEPFDASFVSPLPRRKFQNRLWLHAVLLLLTLATTTVVGALHYAAYISQFPGYRVGESWSFVFHGLWYSGTLLSILGAHEMGHYLLCRRYNLDASLPYFIPVPPLSFLALTGTLGAVIRIREAFPSRKVLFDVGVAGPIAGFAVLVPALLFGLTLSNVVPEPKHGVVFILGEPLLFKVAARAFFGALQDGYTINIHPMVFASWFGMLATALNLLPFGQLDGGHITYAALGRFSTRISMVTIGTALAMTFLSVSWVPFTVIMVAMVFLFGPHHPRVLNEYEPLGRQRMLVAVFALIMLILCFTPVPLDVQILAGG